MSDMDSDEEVVQAFDPSKTMTAQLNFPCKTEREAEILYNTLRVDKEPPRGGCYRSMELNGKVVRVTITAEETKKLKKGLSAFMDSVMLVEETIDKFGPPIL